MKLIRLAQVMECTGLPRSTLYKFIAAGHFPKPVPLGGKAVAWVQSEIEDWILEKVAQRDALHCS